MRHPRTRARPDEIVPAQLAAYLQAGTARRNLRALRSYGCSP